MILQLNPPIPMQHKDGRKCTAYFILDYSQEHASHFLVGYHDTGELWWESQKNVRLQQNYSIRG